MDTNASPSGVYRDAQGRDVYTKTQAPYYVFQIMMMVYLAGFLASLVLVQNAQVPHTHTYRNNNGPLYSERYSSMYWYALMFSACRIFLFISVCSLLLYRKTSCCCGPPGNRGCGYFWTFFLVVWVVLDVCVLAILGSFFRGCNVPGNAGNPCNDLRYCNVAEVYGNADSGCTYSVPWTPVVTLAQLAYNVDFLWLFSVTVVFVAFDLVFLLVPLGMWVANSTRPVSNAEFDVLGEEEEETEGMARVEARPGGGLRKRRTKKAFPVLMQKK